LIVFQVLARFLFLPLVYIMGPMSGMPFAYMILNSLTSVVVGAIMFKMSARALRKYMF
jgi:hypothetical protein